MKHTHRMIAAAAATPETLLLPSDEDSRWGAALYIAVNRDVPGARNNMAKTTSSSSPR